MYLLYADESGSTKDAQQKHFVLAGFCVFERQGFWLANELDKIAERFNPAEPNIVELHGSPMLSGRGQWRGFDRQDRVQAIQDALALLVRSHPSNRIFASIIRKEAVLLQDPVELAFEQLTSPLTSTQFNSWQLISEPLVIAGALSEILRKFLYFIQRHPDLFNWLT